MRAARHLLRYLAGTVDFGITYKQAGFRLTAYYSRTPAGSDYSDNEKSNPSYIMMMCNGPTSLKVKLQRVTAQSTVEADLVAQAMLTREAVSCRDMMKELGFKKQFKLWSLLLIDTASALHAAEKKTCIQLAR